MRFRPLLLASLLLLLILVSAACAAEGEPGPVGPAGAPGPVGPPGPAGEDASASQSFVGSETCGDCHEEIYARFAETAHAHALTAITGDAAPAFPTDEITGGIPGPPEGYEWSDISYVHAGYGWSALFLDQDGYLISGDATKYNFAFDRIDAPAEWVAYHAGEGPLPYDCGSCHTTGYQPQGHQDGLEGIVGSWAAPGVQCEACHGPGSLHAADPQGIQMVVDRGSQLCGHCHVRDDIEVLTAEGGFTNHNQQYEELFRSRHFALSCVTCHDPHGSTTLVDAETEQPVGIRQQCENCHWRQLTSKNERHGMVECVDCHMPPMVISAQGDPELHVADVRSHQFAINPDPAAPQFSEDGSVVMPYITLTYACQQCHNGLLGVERTLEELAAMAENYHQPAPTATPTATATPEEATAEGTPAAEATVTPQATATP